MRTPGRYFRRGRTRAAPAREYAQGTHCDHADPAAEPERDRAGDPSATVEPNDAGLIAGRHYKVSDLSNALLLIWVNDAAAGHGSGDWPFSTGVALMNGEQPSGLPAARQLVSANDEVLIARLRWPCRRSLKYDSRLFARFQVKRRYWSDPG
jgi:hypothetical protein